MNASHVVYDIEYAMNCTEANILVIIKLRPPCF